MPILSRRLPLFTFFHVRQHQKSEVWPLQSTFLMKFRGFGVQIFFTRHVEDKITMGGQKLNQTYCRLIMGLSQAHHIPITKTHHTGPSNRLITNPPQKWNTYWSKMTHHESRLGVVWKPMNLIIACKRKKL